MSTATVHASGSRSARKGGFREISCGLMLHIGLSSRIQGLSSLAGVGRAGARGAAFDLAEMTERATSPGGVWARDRHVALRARVSRQNGRACVSGKLGPLGFITNNV